MWPQKIWPFARDGLRRVRRLQSLRNAQLEPLENDEWLRNGHRFDAVRAHLQERAGQKEVAVAYDRTAAEKMASIPKII